MSLPTFTADQFRDALLQLMPRGRVWPKDGDSNLYQVAGALVPSYVTNSARATHLITDVFPTTTIELLPEWELTTGLPDPCQGRAPSLEARRGQVVARLTNLGGQSIPHLIQFAAALGYTVTITEFAPLHAGTTMVAGGTLVAEGQQFTLRVNAPTTTLRYFRAGLSTAGEALSTFGNAVLQCEMLGIKPAHSRMVFSYSGVLAEVPGTGPIVTVRDTPGSQIAANFVADLTFGLNFERWAIPGGITTGWCNTVRSYGVTHLRIYPQANATIWPFANIYGFGQYLDAMGRALNAGFKVLLDLMDVCTLADLSDPQTLPWIRQCCQDIKDRNWDYTKFTVGFANELQFSTNAEVNSWNALMIAEMRAILPDAIFTVSSAQWGNPDTLTDGTLTIVNDPRVIYTWHEYPNNAVDIQAWAARDRQISTWAAANGVTAMNAEFNQNYPWPDQNAIYPTIIDAIARGAGHQRPTMWAVTGGSYYRLNESGTDPTLRPEIVTAITNATAYMRAQPYFGQITSVGTPPGSTVPAPVISPLVPGTRTAGNWPTTITANYPVTWAVQNTDGSLGASTSITTIGTTSIAPFFATSGQRLRVWQTSTPTNVALSAAVTIGTVSGTAITISPLNPGTISAGAWPTTISANFPLSWVVMNADFGWTSGQNDTGTAGSHSISPSFTATGQVLRVWQTSDPANIVYSGAVTIGTTTGSGTGTGSQTPSIAAPGDLPGPGIGSPGPIGIMLQGQSNALLWDSYSGPSAILTNTIQALLGLSAGQIVYRAMRSDFDSVNTPPHASMFSGTGTFTFTDPSDTWLQPVGHTLTDPTTWANKDPMTGLIAYCGEQQASIGSTRPWLLIRMHDENDSARDDSGELAIYPAGNRELVSRWRAAMGGRSTSLLPVFYAPVTYDSASKKDTFKNIRAAWQADTQDAARNSYLAYSNPIDAVHIGDSSHWDQASAIRVANRLAIRITKWLAQNNYGSTDLSWLPTFGPQIVSAAQSGIKTIDLTVQHDKGTDLLMPTSVRFADFDVLMGGVSNVVTAVTRVDSTTLRLTVTNDLAGTVTVDYGPWMQYSGATTQITDNWHTLSKPSWATAALAATSPATTILSDVRFILCRSRAPIAVTGVAVGGGGGGGITGLVLTKIGSNPVTITSQDGTNAAFTLTGDPGDFIDFISIDQNPTNARSYSMFTSGEEPGWLKVHNGVAFCVDPAGLTSAANGTFPFTLFKVFLDDFSSIQLVVTITVAIP